MANTYLEISVIASTETAEGLSDFLLSEGALGLLTEDLPADLQRIRIRASFPDAAREGEILGRLRRYQDSLTALGFSATGNPIGVHELPILDWARISADQFEPIQVGRRFTIAPPSHQGPFAADRLLIRITPAMAFGTGYSPTTQMCLEGLEGFLQNWRGSGGPLVLDVGTGTGILAIAAAALGAGQVVAIDTDPQACAAARENLALHTWADRVQVMQGSLDAMALVSRFDLILANLDTRILLPIFPALAMLLVQAGQVVVGGITLEEEEGITSAFCASRLQRIHHRTKEGWVCFTLAADPRAA